MHSIRLALVLALAMPLSHSARAADRIKAVASFSILGDMMARVGGDRVDVTTIVGRNGDAHVYEPKPSDAASLAAARLFLVNGMGYEGWMERLTSATRFAGKTVVASNGVAPRAIEKDGRRIVDPHAWQNLSNGLVYVRNIADGLCAVSPADCASFRANATAYAAEIAALDAGVKASLAKLPQSRRKIITTHDALGYFGAAYGIAILAPEGLSTESEASAQDVARLIGQIRREKITALFVENMGDPRLIQQIANETGIKPGGALYTDALSEPDRGAGTYLDMFRRNIKTLIPAMSGG
jgi:zinc/manganese transport system substrate-binding protein